ncbi:MAG: glycosyltransferase family 39 protein [Spirochaetales bacterium]|nr:glycosyltransferase family 39 protein [Spirochaetales bacterium]
MIESNNLHRKPSPFYRNIRDLKEIFIIAVSVIVFTYFYTFVAYIISKNTFPSNFTDMWYIYDACHYTNIADWDYGTTEERRVLIVFLPLFPTLIRGLGYIVGDYLVAALIISNIAYIFAVYFLYRIVRLDYSKNTAIRAVIYFSIFPSAFFLHGAYTESLFCALIIGSFYYARKSNWAVAGILGALVAATRLTGIVIILSLLLEYLHQKKWKIRDIRWDILFIGIVPLGLVWYLSINYEVFGDPFHFLSLQEEVWNKHLSLPTEGGWNAIMSLQWKEPSQFIISALAELIAVAYALFFICWMVIKERPLYTSYIWLTLLVVTSNSYWLSLPRYVLPLFPIYIILAVWSKNKAVHFIIILIFLSFYAFFAGHYTQAHWAF